MHQQDCSSGEPAPLRPHVAGGMLRGNGSKMYFICSQKTPKSAKKILIQPENTCPSSALATGLALSNPAKPSHSSTITWNYLEPVVQYLELHLQPQPSPGGNGAN